MVSREKGDMKETQIKVLKMKTTKSEMGNARAGLMKD